MIARADFMGREGTSTDGPQADRVGSLVGMPTRDAASADPSATASCRPSSPPPGWPCWRRASSATRAARSPPTRTPRPRRREIALDPSASLALPTLPPPGASAVGSSPSASPIRTAVATRVVVEALGIDLPIVKPRGGSNAYPYCNVAMYLSDPRLGQPGGVEATYLYAHARDGMFGPIYDRAIHKQHGGPKSMIGMIAQVYTSDDVLHEYQVTKVLLHQLTLDDAARGDPRPALAPDVRGAEGHARQDPAHRGAAPDAARRPRPAHPAPHPVVCG